MVSIPALRVVGSALPLALGVGAGVLLVMLVALISTSASSIGTATHSIDSNPRIVAALEHLGAGGSLSTALVVACLVMIVVSSLGVVATVLLDETLLQWSVFTHALLLIALVLARVLILPSVEAVLDNVERLLLDSFVSLYRGDIMDGADEEPSLFTVVSLALLVYW